ncbi:hypothetical protein [Rivularia sp. UHCC 0363]|uniref:hypothetical protein n=1 Tax=Rivularia sp. UHCC 0363 TaxID=3110244 RepID=UPI002B1FBA1D|nr:hypothetical protein [Rivularia sp. UHCC 0363]MEA5597170.1 hypothetical protein [Rivularia sp. UHCC 0363]
MRKYVDYTLRLQVKFDSALATVSRTSLATSRGTLPPQVFHRQQHSPPARVILESPCRWTLFA